MASYNSIHVKTKEAEAVQKGMYDYTAAQPKWKFWQKLSFKILEPIEGWTEVRIDRPCYSVPSLPEHLSKSLNCKALSLGYQTVVGQEYIQLCQEGETQRALWFTRCDSTIGKDYGAPLQFESSYIEKRRTDAEEELNGMDPELRADEEQWMLNPVSHLPGCEQFAEALGCKSFRNVAT